MRTIVVVGLLAFFVCGGLAIAADDPVLEMLKDARFQLEKNPGNANALVPIRPLYEKGEAVVSTMKDPVHREALNALVGVTEKAAEAKPKDFNVVHNYYEALWIRFLLYRDAADVKAAWDQLENALKACENDGALGGRCLFEQARMIQVLKPEEATTLVQGTLVDAAAEKFIAAKRRAGNKGYYAAQSALALSEIYIGKKMLDEAKNAAREAMDIDSTKGYVTNHAYDCIGRVLIEQGNLDGAVVMLEAAGKVKADSDIRAAGYASSLAWELVGKDRTPDAIGYLKKVVDISKEKNYCLPAFTLYALGIAYQKQGEAPLALVNLTEYLKSNDLDPARQAAAKKLVAELALRVSGKK